MTTNDKTQCARVQVGPLSITRKWLLGLTLTPPRMGWGSLDTINPSVLGTFHDYLIPTLPHPDNLWLLQTYSPETETFELKSLQFTDTLAALYEDVDLTPPQAAPDANLQMPI